MNRYDIRYRYRLGNRSRDMHMLCDSMTRAIDIMCDIRDAAQGVFRSEATLPKLPKGAQFLEAHVYDRILQMDLI